MKPLRVFLGGAAVGAIAALLLAPESGAATRARILTYLKERGIIPPQLQGLADEADADLNGLMAQISAEIDEDVAAKEKN